MYRKLKLIEDGVCVAEFGIEEKSGKTTIEDDIVNFILKVQKKKQSLSKSLLLSLITVNLVTCVTDYKKEFRAAYTGSLLEKVLK